MGGTSPPCLPPPQRRPWGNYISYWESPNHAQIKIIFFPITLMGKFHYLFMEFCLMTFELISLQTRVIWKLPRASSSIDSNRCWIGWSRLFLLIIDKRRAIRWPLTLCFLKTLKFLLAGSIFNFWLSRCHGYCKLWVICCHGYHGNNIDLSFSICRSCPLAP